MKDSRVSEVLISKESLIKKKGERTDFVMEDDLSEASDYPSSHSSLSLNIRKKIDSLKCSSPAYDSEVESVQSVTELPLSKMEELIQKAIETNSDLRMQLLLCERQLVLLKMRLPKKELIVENEVSNRDSTRGFLSKFMAPYFKDEKGYGIWTDRIKSLSEFSFLQCYNGSSSQRKDYLRVAVAIKQCLVEEKMGQRNLKSLNEKIVSALNREELCAAMKEVRSAEAEIKALKKKTIWKLLESDVDRELDWMKISTYEAANGLSASDCESTFKDLWAK